MDLQRTDKEGKDNVERTETSRAAMKIVPCQRLAAILSEIPQSEY